ncbi:MULTISPECIES: HAMP domain-containing sensor histidine kinase [Bacillus]|uniref:HAMP domain-containing sensor histidine kinase n=1 Tax=Bacillus TaxID=1386 RepID=UPI000BB9BAF7|nr:MULTISPECIES: HAMP domain-containing sensor histidine kinase [Bacillus]
MIKTSIFRKLFITYSFIVMFSFLLFNSIFLYLFHIQLYSNYEDTYNFHHEQIKEQLDQSEIKKWDDSILNSSLQSSLQQKNSSIFLFDKEGKLVYEPTSSKITSYKIEEKVNEMLTSGEKLAGGMKIEQDFIYIYSDQSPLDENGFFMVIVYHDLLHEYEQVIWMVLFTLIITICVAGIILWFISRKITTPLREMNKIALKMAKGDFSEEVIIATKDEIGQLGESFNYMATELESLEEMRREFLANVSHDLRSPLTSIKGFLIALLDGTIPNERKKHYYLLMKEETERLIKLVNDLLEVSQLESGQLKLYPKNYNLTEQLRVITAKLEPQLKGAKMDIKFQTPKEDLYVFADQDRMEQVFINLIGNAIHFSPAHSSTYLKLEKEKDKVKIIVRDEGIGIKEEELPFIWDRFYKSDKARSKKIGTGIGLSIVKSIILLHESDIKVKSEVGIGTEFTFSLQISNNR